MMHKCDSHAMNALKMDAILRHLFHLSCTELNINLRDHYFFL